MNIYIDGLPVGQRNTFHFRRRFQEWLVLRQNDLLITNHFEFNNQLEFTDKINQILLLPITDKNCTITICCHGGPTGLRVNNETEVILWHVIVPLFHQIKNRFPNIIIILAVCEGASIETVNQSIPFVFGFTYKISLKLALETSSLIVVQHITKVPLENILLNARQYVKDNEELIKLI